jgi:hypothetical protein
MKLRRRKFLRLACTSGLRPEFGRQGRFGLAATATTGPPDFASLRAFWLRRKWAFAWLFVRQSILHAGSGQHGRYSHLQWTATVLTVPHATNNQLITASMASQAAWILGRFDTGNERATGSGWQTTSTHWPQSSPRLATREWSEAGWWCLPLL